jgi:hypothetical protein
MAEFCRDCFIELMRPTVGEIHGIQMSEEPDLCEGCGKIKPFVLYIKDEPFCPFVPAYCDVPEAKHCVGCEIPAEVRRIQNEGL